MSDQPSTGVPPELYAEALGKHQPTPAKVGWACTCGKWTSDEWNQAAFTLHVAEFLTNLTSGSDEGTGLLRHFYLQRDEDASGSSGTGRVAEAFRFEDGWVALHWLVAPFSSTWFVSVDDLKAIHGHGGATRLVAAVDEQPLTMPERADVAKRPR